MPVGSRELWWVLGGAAFYAIAVFFYRKAPQEHRRIETVGVVMLVAGYSFKLMPPSLHVFALASIGCLWWLFLHRIDPHPDTLSLVFRIALVVGIVLLWMFGIVS